MQIMPPRCYLNDRKCKYFNGFILTKNGRSGKVVCKAFPEGIPEIIAYGKDLHNKVIDGQIGNFVFEQETSK
jgi:hypothetical protein